MQRLNLSLKRTLRNKKNYFLLVVLMICFVITAVSFVIHDNLSLYVETAQKELVEFRSILVSQLDEQTKTKLLNNPHVIYVGSSYNLEHFVVSEDFQDLGYNGSLSFRLGTEKLVPPAILGENLTDDMTDSIICSYNFFPDDSLNYDLAESKDFLNPKDFLGKSIRIHYSYSSNNDVMKDFTRTYTIVGFFDNTINQMPANTCYLSLSGMEAISKDLYLDSDEHNQNDIIILEDPKYLEEVSEILPYREGGYHFQSVMKENTLAEYYLILNLIVIVSIFCSFMLILNFIYKYILSNLKDYQLRVSLGYRKKDIIIEKILELFILGVLGCIGCFILYFLLAILSNKYFSAFFALFGYAVKFHFVTFILGIFFCLILPFLLSTFFIWFYFGIQNSYKFLNR